MTTGSTPFLPYGRQMVDDDDIAAVADVLRSDWLTTGPAVPAFEDAFAARIDAPHAVACSSGTAALHLAALALGLKQGDRVVVPSMTFLATANAVRFTGAEVIFADVDPDTGLMRADDLAAALDANAAAQIRAVFPVHLAGQTEDMDAIAEIARGSGLRIVEDACHAIGATRRDRPVGCCDWSDMAAFSFHPVKTIACGEGGMVTTKDDDLAARLKLLRNHGMSRDADSFREREQAFGEGGAANPWYYEMAEIGFNYRLSDIHAALGLSQLGKLDRFAARRRALAACYDAALAKLAPLVHPIRRTAGCEPAWHLYPVLIDFDAVAHDRAALMTRLRDAGIGVQVHYIPVHRQPYYRERYGAQTLPGAEAYYRRTLSLPLYPAMADEDVARVVDALAEALA